MSFDLSVMPHEHAYSIPPDPATEEYDDWEQRAQDAELFGAPLGSDGIVFVYLTGLAKTLDLPLLARIYESGLRIDTVADLDSVATELDRLEACWQSTELPDPGEKSALRGQIREHLTERLALFREAIRVTRLHRAVLIVS